MNLDELIAELQSLRKRYPGAHLMPVVITADCRDREHEVEAEDLRFNGNEVLIEI